MAKLDRLGWTDGIAFESHGARIGIRANDPAIFDTLPALLPPGAKPADSPIVEDLFSLIVGRDQPGARLPLRYFHLLYWGSGRLSRTLDLDDALGALRSSLHFAVALRAQPYLFVHAGVVGWRGRAIVLPGRSASGKSTLVAALVRAGATYYSDEYAVFDEQGRVHPYPKPLTLRGANGSGILPEDAAFSAPGESEPLPVGLVVVTSYRSEARWRPRILSPGQAALALFDNTVAARARPDVALATFKHALGDAIALQSRRGEAAALVRPLLGRISPGEEVDPRFGDDSAARMRAIARPGSIGAIG